MHDAHDIPRYYSTYFVGSLSPRLAWLRAETGNGHSRSPFPLIPQMTHIGTTFSAVHHIPRPFTAIFTEAHSLLAIGALVSLIQEVPCLPSAIFLPIKTSTIHRLSDFLTA